MSPDELQLVTAGWVGYVANVGLFLQCKPETHRRVTYIRECADKFNPSARAPAPSQ